MYLDIVNNLSLDKKKNKNHPLSKNVEESLEDEKKKIEKFEVDNNFYYHSIFYGQITQNWIKVSN
jgi:hypothetical protein|tara:strand:- start:243 stop:437 length:195 start_codon:yes stop_codon:yes gene_type:complete